jgi:ribonuclease E
MLDDELPGQQPPTGTQDETISAESAPPRRRAPRRRATAAEGAPSSSDSATLTDEAAGTGRPTSGAAEIEPAVTDEVAGTGRPRPTRRSSRRKPAIPQFADEVAHEVAPEVANEVAPEVSSAELAAADVLPVIVAEPRGAAEPSGALKPGGAAEPSLDGPVADVPDGDGLGQSPFLAPPVPPRRRRSTPAVAIQPPSVAFQPPALPADEPSARRPRRTASKPAGPPENLVAGADPDSDGLAVVAEPVPGDVDPAGTDEHADEDDLGETGIGADDDAETTPSRSRRRRGRRGRGRPRGDDDSVAVEVGAAEGEGSVEEPAVEAASPEDDESEATAEDTESETGTTRRRRRRRRRGSTGEDGEGAVEEAPATRPRRPARDRDAGRDRADEGVRGVSGSTRLEAKRQRRRDGRDTSRRRTPIVTEAEFLARRESVERVMLVRQTGERTQIAVLEDGVLVEHYVTKATITSYAGNVYLGKVQNVLPSMEAAFVDIGKGRNAVLYAGEVNYDATGLEGKPRKIEQALKSGQNVLVQVTKDPMGHKGARLTSQISLAGRYLVYVPEGSMTGISRKLPDIERSRLKAILKKVVPENAGVIIRTAAEGASEEELSRDVARLEAQWQDIRRRAAKVPASGAPVVLYTEPDLVVRVVRDVFNEDFAQLVVQGEDDLETIEAYVAHVAPDLAPRVSAYSGERDIFATYRVDEQLAKALDRKVWLPSGGSLVIDRTEAMIVIDVNTGKFTGKGGNLEETVTKNNLEAAEEIVRQLRLRDLGGIIVIDFIDMVLESNRDLVLRRLTECLGRDRTKHQVAEVTSLGLVQMTRKRVGQGLLEAFSVPCEACNGRGVRVTSEPVDQSDQRSGDGGGGERGSGRERAAAPPLPGPPPGSPGSLPGSLPAPARSERALEAAVLPADVTDVAAAAELDAVDDDLGLPVAAAVLTDPAAPLMDVDVEPGAEQATPPPASGRRRRGSARRPAGPPVVAAAAST